jgi:NTP pyrophosphatase (non-canonical NTP hydrolase)
VKDRLQEIFDKQADYLKSLEPIYRASGFPERTHWPMAINGRHAQEQFRLLAWRINEEVYEALKEWEKGVSCDPGEYREEVADVMHFLVELCLFCGITPVEFATGGEKELESEEDYLSISFKRVQFYPNRMEGREAWGMFLTALAELMMCFRQRPWRTDERLTDFGKLKFHFGVLWLGFCAACVATGIGASTLYSHYFAKSIINEERRDLNMPLPPGAEGCSLSK